MTDIECEHIFRFKCKFGITRCEKCGASWNVTKDEMSKKENYQHIHCYDENDECIASLKKDGWYEICEQKLNEKKD
jgi:hypothetical protein